MVIKKTGYFLDHLVSIRNFMLERVIVIINLLNKIFLEVLRVKWNYKMRR